MFSRNKRTRASIAAAIAKAASFGPVYTDFARNFVPTYNKPGPAKGWKQKNARTRN